VLRMHSNLDLVWWLVLTAFLPAAQPNDEDDEGSGEVKIQQIVVGTFLIRASGVDLH
jgi:hypothetical protein